MAGNHDFLKRVAGSIAPRRTRDVRSGRRASIAVIAHSAVSLNRTRHACRFRVDAISEAATSRSAGPTNFAPIPIVAMRTRTRSEHMKYERLFRDTRRSAAALYVRNPARSCRPA
jgi:hypothetical protein